MQEEIRIISFERKTGDSLCPVKRFGLENAKKVISFHKSFPGYAMTPLVSLSHFAQSAGVKSIHIKDESHRFNLNAFKVLGGSYAIGSYIAQALGMDISELPYEKMTSANVKAELGDITFVTATDGNHGRGIAWTANRLGQKSVVYMPKGSAQERLDNINSLGSDACITELSYDDAVRMAGRDADRYGWVLVQDTSWDGYEDIPSRIMEGYTTMAYEAVQQLVDEKPTHIFLQAGVGSMAGALTAFFADYYGDNDRPIITIVEPDSADCIFRTAEANDGALHFANGEMNSIMAGLCCGEPCSIGWNILKDHADNFVTIPDRIAELGMRILGKPIPGDDSVVSGESGAATFGLVAAVLQDSSLEWLKNQLGIDENSRILCFSTEGDTDRENYRRIVGE